MREGGEGGREVMREGGREGGVRQNPTLFLSMRPALKRVAPCELRLNAFLPVAPKEKDRLHFARPRDLFGSQWGLAACWQWERGAGTGTKKKKPHFCKKQQVTRVGCYDAPGLIAGVMPVACSQPTPAKIAPQSKSPAQCRGSAFCFFKIPTDRNPRFWPSI